MSTFSQTTGLTIQAAFEKFHRANPEVYLLIVKEADKYIRQGKRKFSVKEIVNSMRWEKFFKTTETTLFGVEGEIRKFKIGDQYISRYTRLMVSEYPYMGNYIEMRRIRSL